MLLVSSLQGTWIALLLGGRAIMNKHRPQQVPPKDNINPFRKPVIRPDEKEDQADSGPDRDNPITRESKQPASKQPAR